MDAPTTTSADNGTSGDSGGGGWFTPRNKAQTPPSGEQETPEGSRLGAMRPVGRQTPSGGNEQSRTPRSPQATASRARPLAEPEPAHEAARPPAPPNEALGFPGSGDSTSEVPHVSLSQPASGLPQGVAGRPIDAAEVVVDGPGDAAPDIREAGSVRLAPDAPRPDALPEPGVPSQRPAPGCQASPDAVLIQQTMTEISPVADKVTSYFYALLFVRHPHLRPLFPAAMDTQRDRLLKALMTASEHIDNTEVLLAYLQNLGRGHRKYGTRPEHYPAVGECLIGALSKYASAWDGETEAAWVRAYTTISQVMIDAAAADELVAPAWWHAEIVSHDLRTRDIAVITVRPDQPYRFLAGQYTSLETPWWPRIWRHYSFASAPRSDGLLSFHVKAVPAGWVSNALVHRARPGDIIRLGPPAGTMTVDHTTDSGLLCLGGGTGIAPIKALVEDVADHGERRAVEVFYGARTDHDLYDIDTMLRLQQSHPWLSVRPVIDQQAHLQLPDVIREYGPWHEYDVYLSGPPGMIRSGVVALEHIGIPRERIRHDSVEELVAARD